MLWWLLVLMAIVLLCSCLNRSNELRESAIRALDASVIAGRFEPPVDDDVVWNRKARTRPPRAEAGRNTSVSPSKHVRDAAPLQRRREVVPQTSTASTSTRRKRVTPCISNKMPPDSSSAAQCAANYYRKICRPTWLCGRLTAR